MSAENPQLPPAPSEFPANSAGATGDSTPGGRKRWTLSRIILLPLLAVCLALFAIDVFHGRLPQSRAYNLILDKMPDRAAFDEEAPAGDRPAMSHEAKPGARRGRKDQGLGGIGWRRRIHRGLQFSRRVVELFAQGHLPQDRGRGGGQ